MAKPVKNLLSKTELDRQLAGLAGWKSAKAGKAIARTFVFADFSEAFGFMARAALAAETLGHHPDWENAYKTVKVRLTTHDAGGVTALDIRLAEAMNKAAGS